MPNRIENKFTKLKQESRAALITYVMAYDPDRETSLDIIKELPKAGADILEIGMPFSDPMADGPSIQKAAIRALKAGAKIKGVLEIVSAFRKTDDITPVVLMGYYNPLLNYGLEKFVMDAKESGVDGLLIVDLPPEEDDELFNLTKEKHIALIKLVTPTTDEARLKVILKKASGFIYYVSITGVTGTRSADTSSVKESVLAIRKHTNLPVAVGFGIKDAKAVSEIAKFSDAVVVGSALVNKISENPGSAKEEIKALTKSLAQGKKPI